MAAQPMPKDHGEVYGPKLKPAFHVCVEYNTMVYLKGKHKSKINNPEGNNQYGRSPKG